MKCPYSFPILFPLCNILLTEVVLSFSGVNMFAMLTGSLPYNLERFNIIDMYQKMMDRRMTPLPQYISQGWYKHIKVSLGINFISFLLPLVPELVTLIQGGGGII